MTKSNNSISAIAATLAGTSSGSMQPIPERAYLDAAGIKLARDAYAADKAAGNKWVKFADYARSQGVTSSMVRKGGEARKWIELNIVIPYGLTPEQREAIMAPKSALKGWTEEQKTFRRVNCQQAVGSLTNKIAMHLMTEDEKKALEASKQSKAKGGNDSDSDSEEKPEKKAAPLAAALKKELSAMIVRIQKADEDNLEGFEPDRLCKALNAVIALIR